jgi:hypothetical protein
MKQKKEMVIAVDWSHTKGLITYDGKKLRTEDRKALTKRLQTHSLREKDGEESNKTVQSMGYIHSPSVILEEGCPTSLIYDLLKAGSKVQVISNRAAHDYKVEHGIEKSGTNDAKIMWELANSGTKLRPVNLDDRLMHLHSLYHQYCRYQKARVAMQNMKKAYLRHFGDGESRLSLKSSGLVHPSSDVVPYDIAIDTLKAKEHSLLTKLSPLVAGGESTPPLESMKTIQLPAIKGLGNRIWAGIIVTANPVYFKNLSAYLRFCGLTGDVIESHKYNRHARMLYHMLAEGILKQKDPTFRPIYDKCKADIAEKHPDYTKLHIHNAALNRTATMLAKAIFEHSH